MNFEFDLSVLLEERDRMLRDLQKAFDEGKISKEAYDAQYEYIITYY